VTDADVIKALVGCNIMLLAWFGRRLFLSIDSLTTRINDHSQRLAVLEALCDVAHNKGGGVDNRV